MSAERDLAILTDRFPPDTGGGIGMWAHEMARGLAPSFRSVTVLTRGERRAMQDAHRGAPFRVVTMAGRDWSRTRRVVSALYASGFLLRSGSPVVLASTWQYAAGLRPLRRLFSFRLVTAAHSREVARAGRGLSARKAAGAYGASDRVAAVSGFIRSMVAERTGLDAGRIEVVHNGVDVRRFRPGPPAAGVRGRLGVPGSGATLLSVCRVVPIKRLEVALEALARLGRGDLTYLVVGDTERHLSYRRRLEELALELGVPCPVVFAGAVEHRLLPEVYRSADLFLQCSGRDRETGQEEGLSLTLLEAMASGLPVLATDSGGTGEAVRDGVSGTLVPMEEPGAMAAALGSFLSERSRWRAMGDAARREVMEGWTWADAVHRMEGLLLGDG